ncbi:MAG: polysaccharide deacetylase family protein [Candidatus Levybacteria bacterium]|nr:polysaccharide deacetylase family protein [Candidatus Levybacteria bacterium]
MAIKKRKTDKKTKRSRKLSFLQKFKLFPLLLILLAILGLLYIPFRPTLKTSTKEYKEMTKLPSDVKGTMKKNSTSESFRVPILIYHYVENVADKKDTIRQSLNIPPFIFEKQIETLADNGYKFITPLDLADILDSKEELPQKPVIISFDDGYRDFYTDVLPILKKHDVKTIAYIIPGFLDKPNYMYTWQVFDLLSSGLVEIGAHTVNHAYLKGLSKEKAEYEIKQSKVMLEKKLNIPIVSFAYPYGAFDLEAIDIVKSAGYKTAVSTITGNEVNEKDRFFLFRIHPGGRIGKELINALEQEYPK